MTADTTSLRDMLVCKISQLDRRGALFPLPAVNVDDRTTESDNFALTLRNTRFELLRRREYQTLGSILTLLHRRALDLADTHLCELARILQRHNAWHTGGLESGQADTPEPSTSACWAALDDALTGFQLNTLAQFSESTTRLERACSATPQARQAAQFFLGLDLVPICTAWKFWNRNEIGGDDNLLDDLALTESVMRGDPAATAQTQLQLLLAIGIYYLNLRNYPVAKTYLIASYRASIGKPSRLYPRIASALALCELHLGNPADADAYYRDAAAGLPRHFGPTGWQLRLAEFRCARGDVEGALALVQQIKASTAAKQEIAYNLWARIYELDYRGRLALAEREGKGLFAEAQSRHMARACRYIAERDSST
ncbi:hypothetical protein [Mycobacterium malmoense]|uniref:hypothetical protein n=1 Tax=Mycobacterium malmoense TaxID=1780 RepID=UPI0008F8445D|nr:hypothetical protein [Mycobacterium malmoense]OIN81180.1 hypothetical protein BMG05_08865 [Mycobacterium malmoense]